MRSIEIPITDNLMRKFAALQALTQGTEREILDVESFLQEQVVSIIENKIRDELGDAPVAFGDSVPSSHRITRMAAGEKINAVQAVWRARTGKAHPAAPAESDIAEGLSYEDIDDSDEGEGHPPQMPTSQPTKRAANKASKMTMEDIQNDSQVDDPQTEAVSSGEELSFEELLGGSVGDDDGARPSSADENPFAKVIEIPPDEVIPPSRNRKQMPRGVKAKVSAFTGSQENSF